MCIDGRFSSHTYFVLPTELNKLDKKRLKKSNDSKYSMKTRILKSPSRCPRPEDAPDWTHKSDLQTTTTVGTNEIAPVVELNATAHVDPSNPSNTPHRNPTGGTVARQIFSEEGSSSSSESSSFSESDSD